MGEPDGRQTAGSVRPGQAPEGTPSALPRLAMAAAAAVCLYAAVGFLAVPLWLHARLVRSLSAGLGRAVEVQAVRTNPFALSLAIDGLRVTDATDGATFLSIERLTADLRLQSLLRRAVVVEACRVDGMYVRACRRADGGWDVGGCVDLLRAAARSAAVSVEALDVQGATVLVVDAVTGTRHGLSALEVHATSLSNLPRDANTCLYASASGLLNDVPISLRLRSRPLGESCASDLVVSAKDVPVSRYVPVLAPLLPVPQEGVADVGLTLTYQREFGRRPVLSLQGRLVLRDLGYFAPDSEAADGQRRCSLPRTEVLFGGGNLLTGDVHIARIACAAPEFVVRRLADGTWVWPLPMPGRAVSAHPPRLRIDELAADEGSVLVDDRAVPGGFQTTLRSLQVKADHIDTTGEGRATATASARTDAQESVEGRVEVTVTPLTVTGTVAAQGLDLPRYAPYGRSVLHGQIRSGTVSGLARIALVGGPTGWRVSLPEVSLRVESLCIGRQEGDSAVLNLPSLTVSETTVDVNARRVAIGTITARDGAVHLEREADGGWNLARLVTLPERAADRPPRPALPPGPQAVNVATRAGRVEMASLPPLDPNGTAAPAGHAVAPPWAVSAAGLRLEGCSIHVEDRFSGTPVDVQVEGMTARLDDLALESGHQSPVEISLRVGDRDRARLEGLGSLNPPTVALRLTAAEGAAAERVEAAWRWLTTVGGVPAERVRVTVPPPADRPAAGP